jgi:hypothetical protein
MKKPLPEWVDEAGVEQWVIAVLDEAALEADRQHHMRLAEHDIPGPPLSIFEDEAMDQAQRRGNFVPLGVLLENKYPLSPSAIKLIADELRGRSKRSRGRPKESKQERRDKYPIYDAAREIEVIEQILHEDFPDQEAGPIRDRAITIAAKLNGVPKATLKAQVGKRSRKRRL